MLGSSETRPDGSRSVKNGGTKAPRVLNTESTSHVPCVKQIMHGFNVANCISTSTITILG